MKIIVIERWILLLVFTFLFSKCNSVSQNVPLINLITVDIENASVIDIAAQPENSIMNLEEKPGSFLYSIYSIHFNGDTLYVYTRDNVIAFDKKGKHLFNVGARGNGPEEYISLSSFFLANNRLNLYDVKTRKVLFYTFSGEYIDSQSLSRMSVQDLYSTDDGKSYLGYNIYSNKSLQFCTLNEDFKLVKNFGKRLNDGLKYQYEFSTYKDEIIYWELLNDTIFSIVQDNVYPKYYVDFGKDKITEQMKLKHPNRMEMLGLIDSDENISSKASLVQSVCEDDQKVYFCFRHQKQPYIGIYDKVENLTKTYKITSSDTSLSPLMFLKIHNGNLILAAEVANENSMQESHVLISFNTQKL